MHSALLPNRDEDLELLGLLTLMTQVLRDFADLADSDVDAGINAALRAISEFAGVDRSYLFLEREDDASLIDNTHEWCALGISPEIHNLQALPWDVIRTWRGPLGSGEAIYIPEVSELPDRRREERELLEAQGIQSLIVVPLLGSEGVMGFLGFDSVRRRRRWSDGAILMLRAVADVITGGILRSRAYHLLRFRADHDSLTRLATRKVLLEELESCLATLEARPRSIGVLFIDVDHFKNVNDSLGHREGDRLLGQVARRLEEAREPGDTVARFGGDEFVVLLDGDDEGSIRWRAQKVRALFDEPFEVDGRPARITASAGLVVTGVERPPEDLLRDADAAMYHAKEQGRDRMEIFDPALREAIVSRVEIANELERALEQGELRLVYQPQYWLKRGAFYGVEALVRWEHPRKGWVSPGDFIPVAEETGQIVGLGAWVLRESLRQMQQWKRSRPDCPTFKVSVNLSARQLSDPGLVEMVRAAIEHYEVDPQYLCLELTESALMRDGEAARVVLEHLRMLGITLSIDDFGTGYSSLAYLRNLPVNYLKIDRAFVAQMQESVRDQNVVRAIVSLAKNFDMMTVAEGVEDEEQLRALRELEVDLAQGYYLERPVHPDAIEELWCR